MVDLKGRFMGREFIKASRDRRIAEGYAELGLSPEMFEGWGVSVGTSLQEMSFRKPGFSYNVFKLGPGRLKVELYQPKSFTSGPSCFNWEVEMTPGELELMILGEATYEAMERAKPSQRALEG